VVQALFLIIIADAFFSVVFSWLDLWPRISLKLKDLKTT
jgi:hypothetical protein